MADEKNANGKSVGLVARIWMGMKDAIHSLKSGRARQSQRTGRSLKNPTKTQLYTSIFRHKHDDTPRNRALGVLSNVFLHLHPAKINRDAVRYSYTWGMGGITFYLFLVLTFTGVLLMFYYTPAKCRPSATSCTSSTTCPSAKLPPQHAPLGRAPDGHRR